MYRAPKMREELQPAMDLHPNFMILLVCTLHCHLYTVTATVIVSMCLLFLPEERLGDFKVHL